MKSGVMRTRKPGRAAVRSGSMALVIASSCWAATVTLQQGLHGYAGTTDAWLNEARVRHNYGGDTNLFVQYDANDGGYAEDCTLIRFQLPSVAHDSISSATLALFYEKAISFQDDNYLAIKPYRIHPTNSWFENTGIELDGQGVNWLYRDQNQTLPWGSGGGWYEKIDDGNGTNLVKRVGGLPINAIEPTNWVNFSVGNSVAQWYVGQANHGWVLFSSGFTGGGNLVTAQFASRDSTVTGTRPKLTITYSGARIPWTGLQNGNWDTAATNNWSVGGYPGIYDNGDHVTFDDGSTRTNVNVGAGIAPASIIISNLNRAFTFSGGPIEGTGELVKLGTGTASLLASNAYADATTIGAGTLLIGANGALGGVAAGTTVSNGATLALVNGTQYLEPEPLTVRGLGAGGAGAIRAIDGSNVFAGPVTLAADTLVDATAGSALALSGAISGAGGLTKAGPGLVVFAGNDGNTYEGATVVAAGTLALSKSSGAAIPGALTIGDGVNTATVRVDAASQFSAGTTVDVRAGGLLDLQGFDHAIANLTMSGGRASSGSGALTLGGDLVYNGAAETAVIEGRLSLDGAMRTIQVGNGAALNDLTILAEVSEGSIHKTGTGRLALQTGNAYTSGTTVAEGELVAGHVGALGMGPIELGETAASAALYAAAGVAISNPVTVVAGGSRILGEMDSAEASFHGPITLNHSLLVTVPDGGTVDLAGAIAGGNEATLNKIDAGTVVLSASNSFAGAIDIDAGQLVARHADALGSGSTLYLGTIAGAGTAALTLDGDITVSRHIQVRAGGSSTLYATNTSVGATLGTVTLENSLTMAVEAGSFLRGAGLVSASTPMAGITKTGSGTLELIEANTYEGGTVIAGGTLLANNATGSATGSGEVRIEANATLGGTGFVNRVLVQAGGQIAPGRSIGELSVAGDVTLGGTLKIEVSGAGGGASDFLRVGNILDISSAAVAFSVVDALDDPAYIFASYGALIGPFAKVENLPPNYDIDYAYNGGSEIALVLIPEPATALLAALGAFLLARVCRRPTL